MDIQTFISNYQEAFGMQAELPITFWYSDRLEAPTEKVNGCLFKCMKLVREGKRVSLNAEDNGLRWRKVLHRIYGNAGTCS